MSLLAKFAAQKAAANNAPPIPTTQNTVPVQATEPVREVQSTVEAPAAAAKPRVRKMETAAPFVPPAEPKVDVQAATRALVSFDPFSIITGAGSTDADDVLAMVLAKAEETGDQNFDGPFPLVKLLKGNSGGGWTFGGNVDGEAAGVLPVAKNAFTAVFLGYRLYGVAWPAGMLGHAAAGGSDSDKDKPIWKIQIASADKALVQDAINAGEVYQFTKGSEKAAKFDGLGHFRPGVEFLFYRKGIVFAVRLPDHYSTTIRALESLGGVMKGVGGLKAIPLVVTPYSTDEKGATPWKCHSLRFEVAITPEGKAVSEEFNQIKSMLVTDEDFAPKFADWNKTEVTEDAAAALKEIAGMNPKFAGMKKAR